MLLLFSSLTLILFDKCFAENGTLCHGFRCNDNRCIPAEWKCDGLTDCSDGSDEELCLKKLCSEEEFTCSSGTCLNRSKVCDGKKDCSDGSDEGAHCGDVCANVTCSQKCRATPTGPECYCEDGYSLDSDNKTCSDIDECFNEGFCSQQCTNLVGSYKCSCLEGFELVNRTCEASGSEPLLIFSNLNEIRAFYLRTKRYFLVQKAVHKAASLDADPLESKVYWIEISNRSSVYAAKVDGTGFSVILNNGLMVPEDIAVDYVARNFYFTDSGLKQILACKMDGSMCHTLHNTNVERPRAIALDPPEGLVYWSDWGNETSGIYRSGMDGSRRATLVSKEVGWPNGIAVDHTTNRLYWADAKLSTIEYITLDGKTRKVLLKDEVFHPYSLTVFEDNLYWSDWKTFSLETCNKFTGHKMNALLRENGKHIMGVHVYHPVLATRSNNPCWSSSCSHMCLMAPLNKYRCVCPPGFTLASNEMTCLINDNFPMLLVNDDNNIYHIRPEAVGNSVVTELPTTHIELIGRLAYDWNSKTLYVTDMQRPAIYAFNMTTLIRRELVVNHLASPEGLAFDSSNKNLYWADSSKGTVEVVSTTTSASSTIIVDLSKPMDIVLVQNIGRMFVSTVGDDPSIIMYDMDGENAKLLNMVIATPVALAVHPTASLLYFADPKAEAISVVNYLNPRSEPVVLKTRVGNIISIAVNEKYLYWTDSKHNALNLLKLNASHAHTISLPGVKSGPVSRKVIYATAPIAKRSLGETTCANNNGGCSHLCLASPSGRSCSCDGGMELSKDRMTCKEKECTSEEFSCLGSSKKCVPKEFVCDGIKDCEDGSDEKCEKEPERCPGNDFRCLNGRCIMASWKCDKRDDCGDNSDEIGCPTPVNCSNDQFTCTEGECIPLLWRCDGESDCTDGSDEAKCHTTACNEETQLRCDHGQCIPKSWACDGAPDCFDSTDERNCSIRPKNCNTKEFKCNDGKCIDETLVCDKRADCEDGSDEKNCSKIVPCDEGRFTCRDGTCIYIHEVCDGYKDCEEGEEEVNCTRTAGQCTSEEYFCSNNSRCISKRWICDGDNDCGDAEDENPDNCTKRIKPTLPPHKKILDCKEFSCSFSGECIPWSKVCDKVNDCEDLMDEGPLCAKACSDNNGACSQRCQKTPSGTKCFCFHGYSLSYDGVTCEDVNECNIPGSCSQFCNNTKGGFKCFCADGFFLEHDHKKCKADAGPGTFLYLLPDQIRGIDLSTGSQRVYVSGHPGADMRGMDYDASEGIFFWSDWKDGTINSYTPSSNRRDVLLTSSIRPHFLRWDWIAKNIYYTDDIANIVACNKNGTFCTTIIEKASFNINSFELAPRSGVMFWSVWEAVHRQKTGVIERAELNGSHRVQIVSDRIIWPVAVTVDHIMEMVYWIDTKLNIMECTDFHGLKRRTVVSEGLYYPFSMAIFEDYVYWSDWGSDSLIRCDKFGGKNCIVLRRGNAKSEVVMIVHKLNQPKGFNRCSNHNCAQICLPTRTNYVCKCSSDYEKYHSGCKLVTTTIPPIPTPEPTCPEDYCMQGAKCIISEGEFYCHCPSQFKGDRCELQTAATQDVYDYSWVVGLVVAIFSVGTVVFMILLCRMNRDRLNRARERAAIIFRNTGWIRNSGRLVVDTDDGGACDELMLGKKGSFKQKGFGNPLFGKKHKMFTDPESNDGDFKRWPSYDSGDSAFVSESQTGEGSQLCIDETALGAPKTTDRIIQFFKT